MGQSGDDGSATALPPHVTVVIPTLGNPLLRRAVRSALDQTHADLDVIICADGPEAAGIARTVTDPRVSVLVSEKRGGQREARFRGIHASTADYIAFLDDDDQWNPMKIERQLAVAMSAEAEGAHALVLCLSNRISRDGHLQQVAPRELLQPGHRVADYLFVRRQIRPGAAAAMASMFLMSRAALVNLPPLPGSPYLHEDWAVLIALGERPDVKIETVDEILLDYTVNPIGSSASSTMEWQLSDEWFDMWQDHLTQQEWAEGLLCVTAVMAIEQGERRGALRVARRVLQGGGASWRAWLYFVLSLTLPKALRERATRTVERLSARGRRAASV